MQVAKALVYALEKKFRMWQLPQLTVQDLPLVYLLESNVQRKSWQLHCQYIHSTLGPLLCLFCAKNGTLVIACDICGSLLFFKDLPYSVALCIP